MKLRESLIAAIDAVLPPEPPRPRYKVKQFRPEDGKSPTLFHVKDGDYLKAIFVSFSDASEYIKFKNGATPRGGE